MVHRKFFWCHQSRDSAALLFLKNFYLTKKPTKMLFSEVVEQIEAKLYTDDHLSMRNKSFTHMMSLVTWFSSHIGFTLKPIKIFSRTAGQIEGKLHTHVPQALCVSFCEGIIERSHGLAAILDWRKVLNNVFSGAA